MPIFILLTAGQAEHVRGPSGGTPSAALFPFEREGGLFLLGVDVLADPAHLAHREYLATLPQIVGNASEFPAALPPVDA